MAHRLYMCNSTNEKSNAKSSGKAQEVGQRIFPDVLTMHTLLVLKGAASKGKSSTLKFLIKLLLENNFTETNLSEGFSEDGDCFVVLEKDGKTIAIITFGDPGCESGVVERLIKCKENNVHYIVAASRTRYEEDSVYKYLWDFVRDNDYYGIETSTLVKYSGWGEEIDVDRLNMICAENLLNIINKIFQ